MQSKEDIAVKYATALNEIKRLKRSRDHWRFEAEFHLWRSQRRGRQIHTERQMRPKRSFISKFLARMSRPQPNYVF